MTVMEIRLKLGKEVQNLLSELFKETYEYIEKK